MNFKLGRQINTWEIGMWFPLVFELWEFSFPHSDKTGGTCVCAYCCCMGRPPYTHCCQKKKQQKNDGPQHNFIRTKKNENQFIIERNRNQCLFFSSLGTTVASQLFLTRHRKLLLHSNWSTNIFIIFIFFLADLTKAGCFYKTIKLFFFSLSANKERILWNMFLLKLLCLHVGIIPIYIILIRMFRYLQCIPNRCSQARMFLINHTLAQNADFFPNSCASWGRFAVTVKASLEWANWSHFPCFACVTISKAIILGYLWKKHEGVLELQWFQAWIGLPPRDTMPVPHRPSTKYMLCPKSNSLGICQPPLNVPLPLNTPPPTEHATTSPW